MPEILANCISLEVDNTSFQGILHDNLSNKKHQGNGFSPLVLKSHSGVNLYRNDGVGINFEHIFNGAKEEYDISMFTPRQDPCILKQTRKNCYELRWPSKGSKWGMECRMAYDLSSASQIDITFGYTPTVDLYSHGFVAMMWASYMNSAVERKIHFWGTYGIRVGWIEFGEDLGQEFEVGTISYLSTPNLPYDQESQTLNIIEHPQKKFITPFYYGLIDVGYDTKTISDRLIYLVLFDQIDPIRFAMWNFFTDKFGNPDTHSPAWDWQYVIQDPKVGHNYGYRARVVVKPFKGTEQIWIEYRKWKEDLTLDLPEQPIENVH